MLKLKGIAKQTKILINREIMKTVLITGVLGGMGSATAKLLLDNGYKVIGLDVKDASNLPFTYFKTDLTNVHDLEKTCGKVKEIVPKLDAIIHFAGIYKMDSLVEMDEQQFSSIFDINVFSIYRVNKTFLPLLNKSSKIIMTSSELAPLDPLPFTGIYAITKSTVEKYAYSLKMELQLLDIDVAVIRPGAVKTGLLNASIESMNALCEKTKLYKYNTKKFKKIVNSVESKNIAPIKIAKKSLKLLGKKKVKFVYNINRNCLLRILNFLPRRFQLYVIRKILKSK